MNKKGFTLVEVLAVVAILAILIIIVVPSVTSINKSARKKMLANKLETVKQALTLWSQDHKKCFVYGSDDCLGTCNINAKTCTVTFYEAADEGILKFDVNEEDEKTVINPVDNSSLNNNTITITYNETTNSFSVTTNVDAS